MKISNMLFETTIEELLADSSSRIYFHGASNDQGQDPDNRKIEAPSPQRPFYVTDDIDTAENYSKYLTGNDGRLSDKQYNSRKKNNKKTINSRIYLLRLDSSKKIFDFTKKSDLSKLTEILVTPNALEVWHDFIANKNHTLMGVAETLGYVLNNSRLQFEDIVKSHNFPKNLKTISIDSLYDEFVKTYSKSAIECALNILPIVDLESPELKKHTDIDRRRYIKAKLFELVKKYGYSIIRERDTLHSYSSVNEYAVLDISAIKDITPVPFTKEQLKNIEKDINSHNFDFEYHDAELEDEDYLGEAGLIINKNDGAYPKSDQVLIMAGGAGSGKSFILDKLLLFNGKVFNPDDTLELLLKYGRKYPNSKLAKNFKNTEGKELRQINLKDSSEIELIYDFLSKTGLHLNREAAFFKSVQNESQKPNIIFDIQMKSIDNIGYINEYAILGKYDPKNIHLVWVLNDVNIALNQNSSRNRNVDTSFLRKSHIGVAQTFNDLIKYTSKWQKIINGDIWIVFNKAGIDVHTVSSISKKTDADGKTSYTVNTHIDDKAEHPYFAVHMKERGKPAKSWDQIDKAILDKIKSYVPEEAQKLF